MADPRWPPFEPGLNRVNKKLRGFVLLEYSLLVCSREKKSTHFLLSVALIKNMWTTRDNNSGFFDLGGIRAHDSRILNTDALPLAFTNLHKTCLISGYY